MQCPQGGEAWRKPGVASDERGIIVIVLPLWSNGYMSIDGQCFDIDIATRTTLQRFQCRANPLAGSTDPCNPASGNAIDRLDGEAVALRPCAALVPVS